MDRRIVALGAPQLPVRGGSTGKSTPPVNMDQVPAGAVPTMLMSLPGTQSQKSQALRETALRGKAELSSANTTVNTQRSESRFAVAVQHVPISTGSRR